MIVGEFASTSNSDQGFEYSHGTYTLIDFPGAADTVPESINDKGQITGFYTSSTQHGFVYSNGQYTSIDAPGDTSTVGLSINNSGQVAGYYFNSDFQTYHGFVATPPPVMMEDVVSGKNLTTLSGIAEANSSVSIFDNTKLIGNVTSAADGTWNFQTKLTGSGIRTFTETSVDGSGFTATSAGETLFSQTRHLTLQGGSGNDVLIGAPNDFLKGNAGSDTFVFNNGFGKETVADFNTNQDVLAFAAAQVLSQAHDTSFGAVIVVDPHDTVTLTGVTVARCRLHRQPT